MCMFYVSGANFNLVVTLVAHQGIEATFARAHAKMILVLATYVIGASKCIAASLMCMIHALGNANLCFEAANPCCEVVNPGFVCANLCFEVVNPAFVCESVFRSHESWIRLRICVSKS